MTTNPSAAVATTRPCAGWRSSAVADASARPGPEGHDQEGRQQQHRVGEVGDDHPGRKGELDRDRAEEHLDHQEHQGQRRRPPERRLGPVPAPSDGRDREDQQADEGRGPAVPDLDQGGEVERWEPLAVAARPMVAAAHPGAGDPHHPAEHDQAQRKDGAGPGQPAKQTG